MLLRHLKVFGIAAVFAAIAYGAAHLLFRLIHNW
jgi:hypothetical protein